MPTPPPWNLPYFSEAGSIDNLEGVFDAFSQALHDALTSMLTNPVAGLRLNSTTAGVTSSASYTEVPLPSLSFANGIEPSGNGFLIPRDGIYMVNGWVRYLPIAPSSADGSASAKAFLNGSEGPDIVDLREQDGDGHSTRPAFSTPWQFAEGDIVTLQSWQDNSLISSRNRGGAGLGITMLVDLSS